MPSTRPLRESLRDAHRLLGEFVSDGENLKRVEACAAVLAGVIRSGGKVLACGNGGSLCDAAHFAEELTGRFRADRRPLPALACAEPGHLTCTANDYGFDEVFARWVTAMARRGDALVLLSTSGNSENIVRAAEAGRQAGAITISLLGKGGGRLRGVCVHEVVVPGETSDRIQEIHMLILHAWVEGIEAGLG